MTEKTIKIKNNMKFAKFIYDVIMSDNKMHGNGCMIWNNKIEKYSGKWDENQQSGMRVYIRYDKKIGYNKYLTGRYVKE